MLWCHLLAKNQITSPILQSKPIQCFWFVKNITNFIPWIKVVLDFKLKAETRVYAFVAFWCQRMHCWNEETLAWNLAFFQVKLRNLRNRDFTIVVSFLASKLLVSRLDLPWHVLWVKFRKDLRFELHKH